MEVQFVKSAIRRTEYPQLPLPTVAFSGRSNVGKSSLINSLVGRKGMARVGRTPGRTRTINFFAIENRWLFADLPGYGFAQVSRQLRSRWSSMVEEFLHQEKRLKLVILVVDARRRSPLDEMMRNWLDDIGVSYRVVATKSDKVSSAKLRVSMDRLSRYLSVATVLPYSAATGMGRDPLWHIIRED